jgi:hypothetical protein
LVEVTPDRAEHPSGDDDDPEVGLARRGERTERARAEDEVLADQRAVEVARERLDVAREVVGQRQDAALPA